MDNGICLTFILTALYVFGDHVSADSKSCKGYINVPVCNWELVFHAVSGNSEDVLKAWTTKHSNCDLISGVCPCSINDGCLPFNAPLEKFRSNTKTLRSPYLDFWSCLDIAKIKFELNTSGETVAFIEFDGRNTTDLNWFHNSRILNSTWSDMHKTANFTVFSIDRDYRYGRNFVINTASEGCYGYTTGYLYVSDVDNTKPCSWEKAINETYPQFLYSKIGKASRWHTQGYGTADVLNIYIQRE